MLPQNLVALFFAASARALRAPPAQRAPSVWRAPGRLAAARSTAVRMQAWTEPDFSAVSIKSVKPSTGAGLIEVTIEAPDEFLAAYSTAGQYVQLRPNPDVKPGFFAIASAPKTSAAFEFLIKETEATQWLAAAKAGTGALMSAPAGKGYSTDLASSCTNIALCAAGSGIAPLRAFIEAGVIGGRSAQLFYGCRSLDVMAYQDRFSAWEKLGVEVVPVLSRAPDFAGAKGYVQAVLPAQLKTPSQTVIVLCGGKEMQIGVKEAAAALGVPEGSVLTNF